MTDQPSPVGKTRRGRPPRSSEQAEAGRGRIVEVARQLFIDEGYAGVSMRKIAGAAGCSPAALYTLFPNKRQLLLALWGDVLAALGAELELAVAAQPAGLARLRALCLAFTGFWLARPDDYRAIFLIEDRLQGPQDRYFVDSSPVLPMLDVFRRTVVEAQAVAALRPGDPQQVQNLLLCALQGLALNLITIPEYPWGEAGPLAEALVDTLLRGLA